MMDKPPAPIFLISGVPGSGKTSVAISLMRQFRFGLHLPVDDLREWVVSGFAPPFPEWTEETERQFRLARRGAAQIARLYAEAGFSVAVADVLDPGAAQMLFEEALPNLVVHRVVLVPRLEVVLARNATRTNKNFDTSHLDQVIRQVHAYFQKQPFTEKGWIMLDSSDMSLQQTVAAILDLTRTHPS